MDPLAVLRTLWNYKSVSIPVLFVTLCAATYVFFFAPHSFESTASYAVINPSPPSNDAVLKDPALGKLNSDNPYLRSSDSSLIVQVVLTRLNDKTSSNILESQRLSTDYTVSRGAGGGTGFLLDVSGRGHTPEESFATTRALGEMLQRDLYDLQKVNGADDRFLFTSIIVAPPVEATEQFSSRLRSVIVVLLGGVVLMFGGVSMARSLNSGRTRSQRRPRRAGKRTKVPAQVETPHHLDPKVRTSSTARLAAGATVIVGERVPEASQ